MAECEDSFCSRELRLDQHLNSLIREARAGSWDYAQQFLNRVCLFDQESLRNELANSDIDAGSRLHQSFFV